MTLAIWKDKIILNWNGCLPGVRSPQDVIPTWAHLNGFVRYSERMNAYLLTFSLQNIARLEKQFGQLPIRSGADRVRDLREKALRFNEMVAKAERVKSLPFERLPAYNYKAPPLAEYQHRANVYLCNIPSNPLFADCGLGKAWMVLNSTQRQIELGLLPRGKTLICAKLATLESAWLEDVRKFTDLKVISLWLPQVKNRKERILELLNTPADAYLINHDGVRVFKEALTEKNFQKVVVDESTILKSFRGFHKGIKGGQFGRSLLEVARHAAFRTIMSGTPASNSIEDLWGQFAFLDPDGFLLEPSFHDFQNEYMEVIDLRPRNKRFRTVDGTVVPIPMDGRTPKKWIAKKDANARVGALINPLAFRAKLRDHLKDLPPLTVMKRLLDMDTEQARHYRDMDKRLRVELEDTRIAVPVMLAKLGKLRQITGGFIIDHEEKPHPLPKNPKLSELESILEDEIGDEKVIVFCQYRWEIETIVSRYKTSRGCIAVYGGNSAQENLSNISRFIKDDSVRMIVAQPQSTAHGITWTNAHYMIFYSINHSAELDYQAKARIERASQSHAMFVYYLLVRNSIDIDMFDVVQTKCANQEEILDEDRLLLNAWKTRH